MKGQDKAPPAGKKRDVRQLIGAAFAGDRAPPELSVAIVSLVELCQVAMPDPAALREAIQGAGFAEGPPERADEIGGLLALDQKVYSSPVRNLRHQIFARERNEARVRLLISEGESPEGKVVFVSTIFAGAIEADAVKAAAHVTKKQPLTGATVTNANGLPLRRVFWDTKGESGVLGLMVTGPQDVDAWDGARAFTAFNLAGKRKS